MSRPNAGPPPVQTSAVARRDEQEESTRESAYAALVKAFDRPDRQAEMRAMLGSDDNVQRFLAVAFHAIVTDSKLLKEATVASIIQAVKDSASLGLEPTGLTGEGWIIVYGRTATFQPGYRGYLKRIRNSGIVQDIDCQLVYMNDAFDLQLGTDPDVKHTPKLVGELDEEGKPIAERGDYRGAYAWARMPSGTKVVEWMTTADIQSVRTNFSKAANADAWVKSWGEMARKTVIRRLAKRLPQNAVDQLLRLDAEAERLADEEPGGKALDVAGARSAVLAALEGKGNIPSLPAGTVSDPPIAASAPAAEPEPVHVDVVAGLSRQNPSLGAQPTGQAWASEPPDEPDFPPLDI